MHTLFNVIFISACVVQGNIYITIIAPKVFGTFSEHINRYSGVKSRIPAVVPALTEKDFAAW